jgi:DDE superfamily endonuclease
MKEWEKTGEIGLYYFDESGFSNLPEVQRAWSPLGVPHMADATVSRARANVLGSLDFGAEKLIFTTHSHSIKETDVITFLDQLAAQSPPDRWNICVLDNAPIHRHIDENTRNRLFNAGLILYFIPAYSPEPTSSKSFGNMPNTIGASSLHGLQNTCTNPYIPCSMASEKIQYLFWMIT